MSHPVTQPRSEGERRSDRDIAFHSQARYKYYLGQFGKQPGWAVDEHLEKHEKRLIALGEKYNVEEIHSEKLLQKILEG